MACGEFSRLQSTESFIANAAANLEVSFNLVGQTRLCLMKEMIVIVMVVICCLDSGATSS